MDELQQAGVAVVFLNRELGGSPEDDLLLQVQGMIAEYERAKILDVVGEVNGMPLVLAMWRCCLGTLWLSLCHQARRGWPGQL
jgi:hypothetical protein